MTAAIVDAAGVPLAGGVPPVHAGEIVGGFGSSSCAPEDDLHLCAAAADALAKLGW